MRLTVITPTIGRASLMDAIASVKAQTHRDVEHLIYHDLIHSGYGNVPRGILARCATGRYLMYLDDDNVLYPDACANVVAALYRHGYPDVLVAPCDMDGVRWLPKAMRVGLVDSLQLVVRADLGVHWPATAQYEADGVFAEWLVAQGYGVVVDWNVPSVGNHIGDHAP